MLAAWQAADDIELFESGWTFDHFYPIFSDPDGPCMEGWTTLPALAQATRRLRVGVLVTGNVYRHPAVLANMAATLDIISGGRLELGLGAGWNEQECSAYGIDLPPLTERFDRFDEACEVILGLLTNEHTDFAGKHYQLTAARCEPKPIQRPHPPVCIGGGGEAPPKAAPSGCRPERTGEGPPAPPAGRSTIASPSKLCLRARNAEQAPLASAKRAPPKGGPWLRVQSRNVGGLLGGAPAGV